MNSMYAASPATEWHDSISVREASASGMSSGCAGSSGLTSMKADSGSPTASGLTRAWYPAITPRSSSRRTRAWTAETDRPVASASRARVVRASATSSRTMTASMSLMARLYARRDGG